MLLAYKWKTRALLLCFFLQNLKSHAVTMFEVGKLSDESLDSFLVELEKVSAPGWHVCSFPAAVVAALLICPLSWVSGIFRPSCLYPILSCGAH